MSNETEEKVDYKKIEQYYLPTEEDDDFMLELKNKVYSLTEPEKRVFLLYTELGSYSAVGRELNCSAPTVKKYIDLIRDKIKG